MIRRTCRRYRRRARSCTRSAQGSAHSLGGWTATNSSGSTGIAGAFRWSISSPAAAADQTPGDVRAVVQ